MTAEPLHPGAWWLWALALGTAASRGTNPLLLALVLAVAGFVVAARRSDEPWSSSYGVFLRLGLVVILVRTLFHIVFGGAFGTTVLFRMPELPLPGWAVGIRIGGAVTAEGLVAALYDGLRLATLLACVGAANALANPKRLLRSLPAALYEVSVAVVVTLSVAPQLITSARQVRRARLLRGDSSRGLRAFRTVLVPVLQDALDRSLALAAAMDSRGYGRTAGVPVAVRRATGALLLGGLLGMCIGMYGLLDAGSPVVIGVPTLLAGLALAAAGLLLASRRVPRSRYRPARWRAREAVVVLSGLAAVAAVLAAEALGDAELVPPVAPLAWPALPLLPAAGVLVALLPAWVAPDQGAAAGVIRFEGVTITYPDATAPALAGVDLEVPEGELCVVVGRTGSGKSTLLAAVNGLVPHFTGGRLAGRVMVDGRDTRTNPPRELADVVGVVGQDPVAGFVTDAVEEELAYSMESIGLPPAVMRRRVEETLDLLGLADLRDRALATLSGGQQQRVAIGAALTAHPRVLVLDEPTSALDPGAAEEVLAALHRLVHDLGVTVLMAEHRLERVAQFADRVVWLPGGGAAPVAGGVGEVLARSPVAPPVVRLSTLAGWDPPAVSVRDARRRAAPLRARLAPHAPAPKPAPETRHTPAHAASGDTETRHTPACGGWVAWEGDALLGEGVGVRYGNAYAVRGVGLRVGVGERVALMGRNGSGKSSLLWALQGTGARHGGVVSVGGADPAKLKPAARRRAVGLVPQQPSDLLYRESVGDECAQADAESHAEPGSTRGLLDRIVPGIAAAAHPRDLSEGQRLAVALAVTLAARPGVLLLDEPTRGLDYPAKTALAGVLREFAGGGIAVLLATHDVEFVAEYASRVVLLADGEIIADGPVDEVITSSPVFAPQVAKVLAPQRWLTVAQVAQALDVK